METNRALITEISTAFEEIFEYNGYTWDEVEFRIAYKLQRNILALTCDNDLYTCNKQRLKNIIDYFAYYMIGDNIRNLIPILDGIIRFDYKKMKHDNEKLYLELNAIILHPNRVQNMATTYAIEFFEYLDAIM